jgi:hypothetical protein
MVVKTGAFLKETSYKVVAVMFFGKREVVCFLERQRYWDTFPTGLDLGGRTNQSFGCERRRREYTPCREQHATR